MLELSSRRGLLLGLGGVVLAAPAIVRASSLMAINAEKISKIVVIDSGHGYTVGDSITINYTDPSTQWIWVKTYSQNPNAICQVTGWEKMSI